MPKRNVFGHIRASGQFGPNRAPPTHPPIHPPTRAPPTRAPPTQPPPHPPGRHECFWAHSGFSPIWSEQTESQNRIFLGTFGLQPKPVRTAGMPKRNVFGHLRASGQFGPNGAPPTHPPTHPPGRHECFWARSGFSQIRSEQPECQKPIFLGTFRLRPDSVRTARRPKTNVFGHIPASAQFVPHSRNAKNESFWAHSGFSPIWSEQPECRKGMFLGTFGLQAKLVRTGRHPPTHPPTRAPPTHPPTHPGATHPGATHPGATHPPTHPPGRQECFWAIWSEQPECQKRIFLGTCGLQPNLVRTAGMPKNESFWAHSGFRPIWSKPGATHPPTHPPSRAPPTRAPPTHQPTHLGATNVFGHIPTSGQFGPNRAPRTHPPSHPPGRHPPGRHPPTHPATRAPRMFLGTFRLQPNLVRTAGMPKTNLFGHIRASAQFGPNSRNAKNESFWAHSGFSPRWSEQPECRKGMFLGTFGLQANLVRTGRHPPTHPPTRAPATHPPTHPGATHPPTNPPGRHECFWARSGFSPIWSEQPECQKRIFLGTFRLQPNLVRTAGMPKTNVFWAHSGFRPIWSEPGATHPPTHPPGRHPPTHPPTHPGATNVFGHIPASAQFGPNSRNAKNESFWAPLSFSPIWSKQPECQKRIFLGTLGLRPNLVRTAGMPKTNVFGYIRASGQVGQNRAPPTHPPTHPAGRHPPGRHPPTHPPTHPPGRHESFWAHSGFSPSWSEQPECQKRIFLGTFGLQPNLVRIAGTPKTNLFGHIRASAQFGPNSRNAENECFWAHSGFRPIWSEPGATHPTTHPPSRAPPTRAPPTHPPTHPPTRAPRKFLGTFRLQPNLVRTAGMPKTNLFGHIRASAQFGPNSRNAKNESFWAHSGFRPIWSEPGATHPPTHSPGRHPPGRHAPTHQPTRAPRMILGTFRLQPNLVGTAGMPKTNLFGHIQASAQFGPNSRNAENECFWAHSGLSPIWSAQPECQKQIFLGTFGLQPNLVRTAGVPKRNVFGHIRASGQFGPNRAPPTHPPTHPGATHPPTHPPGRQECFWAIWSEQPECQKRIFLGKCGLQPNLVRTAGMPKTKVFGHIRASGQFGPNRAQPTHPATHPPGRHLPGRHPPTHPPTWAPRMFLGTFQLQANLVQTGRHAPTHPATHPGATHPGATHPRTQPPGRHECFWAHSGFSPIWSEQPECQKRIFLGTFGLQPKVVRTAGMPKRNVFGHIRASGQFGPNRAPPTHPPTHPGATHPPTHPPGRHPPTHQPTRAPRMFLGTFRLQPNLVRTAGMPKTNLFGHIQASAQFGPNSRNAKNESFWAHSGFSPVWSEQPECRKGMF